MNRKDVDSILILDKFRTLGITYGVLFALIIVDATTNIAILSNFKDIFFILFIVQGLSLVVAILTEREE